MCVQCEVFVSFAHTHVLRDGPEACSTAELYKAVLLLVAEASQPPVPLAEAIPQTHSSGLFRHCWSLIGTSTGPTHSSRPMPDIIPFSSAFSSKAGSICASINVK